MMILVAAAYISCKRAGNKTGSVDGSDTLPISEKGPATSADSTTLDSLQGIWKHTGDDTDKIRINEDTVFRYSGNDKPDTSFFALADSCMGDRSIMNNKKKNGKRILEYASKRDDTDNYIMCFDIDYLANDSLILFYEGGSAPKPMLYIRSHLPR